MKVVATIALLQLCLSATGEFLQRQETQVSLKIRLTLFYVSPPSPFLLVTGAVSGNGSTETALTAAPGDIALLPCYTVGNVTPTLTAWMKNGREVIRGGGSSPSPLPAGERLAVLHDGSLNIRGVIPGDEGAYLCNSTLPGNNIFRARVLLQVISK